MAAYPNLGFDPCPGDLNGYQALADYAMRSAAMLSDAEHALASAGSSEWHGEAANAFRSHVQEDVLPLAKRATSSIGRAASALRSFALTLAQLQQEAATLNSQAGPWQDQRTAALAAAKLPSTATAPYPATIPALQHTRLEEADSALSSITARTNEIQAEYTAAVQRTAGQLDSAGNMAPHPPGLFSSLWHDVEANWDEVVHVLSDIVHDKALLQFISGVANVIASVAGLLALFPPLTAIFGPIALAAGIIALASDSLLAIFDHGSWVAVGLDAFAVVSDLAWMKAAGKLADMYEAAGLEKVMTKSTTYSGLISKIPLISKVPVVGDAIGSADHTVNVAPGMFRMIGESLKESVGSESVLKEISAVTDPAYSPWRAVDIVAGQTNWTAAGIAITQIPGTVHNWVDDFAEGKDPWQVPSS
jgi:hypothetical protein